MDLTNKTALEHYNKADKQLRSWWGSESMKSEKAAELFEKAANSYKITKHWDNAGEAFLRAATCLLKDSPWEAITYLTNAAECYKKSSVKKAINAYGEASRICMNEGKFQQGAQILKNAAETCEKDGMIPEAINYYKQAIDMSHDESSTQYLSCLQKIAELQSSSTIREYAGAITCYEELANRFLDSNTRKWGVNKILLGAFLCQLALTDIVAASRALTDYEELSAAFTTSDEGKFARKLLSAIETYDLTLFSDCIKEFDRLHTLSTQQVEILLTIKQSVPGFYTTVASSTSEESTSLR